MKRTISLILTVFALAYSSYAQDKEHKKEGDVYQTTDISANPTDGFPAYFAAIGKNIKYPADARKNGIEGKVFIELIIGKKGEMISSEVIKGIGSGCDEVALEAVRKSGSWTAAQVDGKPVKQKLVLPVMFALGKTEKEGK